MMAFINLMLKDLNVHEDPHASGHASPDSATTSASSHLPSRSNVSRYLERACLIKIVEFCAILPDWPHLQALIQRYLWQVDWKFLVTAQDLLEGQMQDLWIRVIRPSKDYEHHGDPNASASAMNLKSGDLSRLALLATVVGETVESMDPDSIAQNLPISRPGVTVPGPIKLELDGNPRARALVLLTYHVPALIEECVRLDEMTLDLVQANLAAFSLWSNQGLHGTGTVEFPRWNVTIRAAKACNLFEDPGNNSSLSQYELDHRRRLAWLVYGYDHAFAVGANTKPLIVESQFSVDQPSDAAPFSASGAPPDPCLAMLEVQGGKMAQLVSSTLCYGPPLHRKAMETDSNILSVMSQLHPSYAWENPDLSLDSTDPFRARRRTWLQLTTAWQRGSLHRQFFFPNGRITNGELATSRHIATDSALRSITAVRELRKMQNRFSDYMSSAWWFQYLTEPSMTLATAALLLIRSKGQGVPGLASEATCWPTMMHFTKTIDECLEDLQGSTRNPAACLPSFLAFAQGCIKLIRQLRSAVHTSLEALVKSQPDLASLQNFEIDEKLIPLLHPRSRQKSPVSQTPQASGQSSESSSGSTHITPKQGTKRPGETTRKTSANSRTRKSIGSRDHDISSRTSNASSPSKATYAENLSVSPRSSIALSNQHSAATAAATAAAAAAASMHGVPSISQYGSTDMFGQAHAYSRGSVDGGSFHNQAHSNASTSPRQLTSDLPSGTLSLSFGPNMGFGSSAAPTVSQAGVDPSIVAAVSSGQVQQPLLVAAPHFGVPAPFPEGHLLSPAEPFALRDFYSDDGVQRANGGRGLADWIASVQMDVMMSQPPAQ